MAYNGGIDFSNVDFGHLELFSNLRFNEKHKTLELFDKLHFYKKHRNNKHTLITNVWEFRNCYLKRIENAVAAHYEILDSRGIEKGWIMFDIKQEADLLLERGVVVGRTYSEGQWEYHMLLVRQRDGKKGEYERVGTGKVQNDYLVRQPVDIRVF